MKKATFLGLTVLAALLSGGAPEDAPQFTKDNELIRPADYREWIYLSSGLGMSYGTSAMKMDDPPFDNVFVKPAAYSAFLESGRWPDRTIFVLEVRASKEHGSINKTGHFQGDLVSVEASVKDESRFADKWAYFGFGGGESIRKTAKAFPSSSCHSCHNKNGAVDNTFVQFYPTLLPVAEAKGTLNAGFRP